MPETSTNRSSASAEKTTTSEEKIRSIVSRILSLSIFFVGIGVFSAIGLGMSQASMFAQYQLTYFAVGLVVGVVGLLLWLVAR